MIVPNLRPLNIQWAVDGSEHSLAAAHFICSLPLPPGSEVTALAVLTPRHTPGRAALSAALEQAQAIQRDCGTVIQRKN